MRESIASQRQVTVKAIHPNVVDESRVEVELRSDQPAEVGFRDTIARDNVKDPVLFGFDDAFNGVDDVLDEQ